MKEELFAPKEKTRSKHDVFLLLPHFIFTIAFQCCFLDSKVKIMKGYVYLIESAYGYKIGKSKTPKTRSNLFSVKLPFEIEMIKAIEVEHYHQVEKDLHKHFEERHLNGEWFDLTTEEVEEFESLVYTYNQNYKNLRHFDPTQKLENKISVVKFSLEDKNNYQLAKIENEFVLNAQYKMTTYEQKVFLLLISRLKPKEQDQFCEIGITIDELEDILKATEKKDGRLYEKIDRLQRSLLKQVIEFPSTVKIEEKYLVGGMTFFSQIVPGYNAEGKKTLFFLFNSILQPFLLKLNEYVQINQLQVAKMKSSHAIRIYTILKALRSKRKNHETKSEQRYTVNELKKLLGIERQYKRFYNFEQRVLQPSYKEINQHTDIRITDIQKLKKGKRVIGLVFCFTDKKVSKQLKLEDLSVKKKEDKLLKNIVGIDLLTHAQKQAYEHFVNLGVNKKFIIEKIIPSIQKVSTEVKGYEDIYAQIVINDFQARSKASGKKYQGGVFVNWWKKFLNDESKKDSFRTMLVSYKRTIPQNERNIRYKADDITWKEYEQWTQKQVIEKASQQQNSFVRTKNTVSLGDVMYQNSLQKPPFVLERAKKDFSQKYQEIFHTTQSEYLKSLQKLQKEFPEFQMSQQQINDGILNRVEHSFKDWYENEI